MVLDSVRIDLAELMRRKLCVHSQNIVIPLSGRQSPRRDPPRANRMLLCLDGGARVVSY